MPRSKRDTPKRSATEQATATRALTPLEAARLLGSLPPDVTVTVVVHLVSGGESMNAIDNRPLTIKEAARLLRVSEKTVQTIVGLKWICLQATGKRKIKRVTAESVRRLLDGKSEL